MLLFVSNSLNTTLLDGHFEMVNVLIKWVRETITEAIESGKVKYVFIAAAIGAVVAIPVPLLGPFKGAIWGALIGGSILLYKHIKNLKTDESIVAAPVQQIPLPLPISNNDLYEQLIKLDQLLKTGILTTAEHQELKSRLIQSVAPINKSGTA